ncbi:MAG TPA: alkaline phosphatase family protein [Rhizomicrobium sp.]|jgi:phospholipase C|nr:alkaline phosphatase family protein [Rhizomicrobium sp.]
MNFGSLRRKCAALTGGILAALLMAPLQAPAATAPKSHNIKTVFIILMENHNWTGDGAKSIKGNPNAPYINDTLLPMASHTERYFNPPNIHPSLPNYLWLEAGTNFDVLNDGPPSRNHQGTTDHLVTLLENAGVTWKGYMENISGRMCPLTDTGKVNPDGNPSYAVRHDPFVYFDDVTNDLDKHAARCLAHVRPYKELAGDLASGNVAQYNWITPNLCDDMHDTCGGSSIANGDKWLSKNVPVILNSAAFQKGGALFITWDEADSGDGPIPTFVVSQFAKGNGYSNTIKYTHGSMLRTMQEIFGVKPYLGDVADQKDLRDLFTVFP